MTSVVEFVDHDGDDRSVDWRINEDLTFETPALFSITVVGKS